MGRLFRLTDGGGSFGLSCNSSGVFLAGVPLLRIAAGGFAPRQADEIQLLIGAAYGPDIDPAMLSPGLEVIAKALSQGDSARAMVAAVHLKLPDLDWEGAARITCIEDALAKYNFNPDEPRDVRGRWTSGDAEISDSSANSNAAPRSETADNEVNPETITPVAYNGYFHDIAAAEYASYLQSKGEEVLTEVRLAMADGSAAARIDILARDPTTNLIYGVEVKTGINPGFTPGQITVYPHLMWGGSVVAVDGKVLVFGLTPGIPLESIPVFLVYRRDVNSNAVVKDIDPDKMYRYYRGR